MAAPFAEAVREEAQGDPAKAVDRYLDVVERAAESPPGPWQVAALYASLDALVARSLPAFAEVDTEAALVQRLPVADTVARRLEAIREGADDGPFAAGIIARALEGLARARGDAQAAERWRRASGCAREATVIGPVAWATVSGLRDPDPLDRFDAPIVPIDGPGPFAGKRAPVVVRGKGCAIDPGLSSAVLGVRDVVVDVPLDRARTIGVALRSRAPVVLRAGGRVVLERPYELGAKEAVTLARLDATQGVLRFVARVGVTEESMPLELSVWDEKGAPLATRAPALGEKGSAQVTGVDVVPVPDAKTPDESLLAASGALGLGRAPVAEWISKPAATRPDARPEIALVYARAVESSRDLPWVQRAERARAAYERVLDAWPGAWEAILAHATLAAVRRGQTEARIEALRDLDQRRAKGARSLHPTAAPWLDAFDAITSGREHLFDRARAALDRAERPLAGTALLHAARGVALQRVGVDRVAYACAQDRTVLRDRFDCYDALRSAGDWARSGQELERLRTLYGAPAGFSALALRDALAAGDFAAGQRIFDAMLPGERTLSALYALAAHGPGQPTREALLSMAPDARDAPGALAPLLRGLGDDPLRHYDGVAERLAATDRRSPILPTAATAVLAHDERYEIHANGVVHYVLFDVRRVSGTTDVEQNAAAGAPDIDGRTTFRALRRRILKKDGRVLEPDRTPFAAQAHAELAQLEQGDIVEAIYEGWGLPDETGNLGVDSPDLLPERTAVHEATITLTLPRALRGSLWSHPLLGKPAESFGPGATRTLRWTLKDRLARRIEEAVPKMDRSVSVSFSTMQWSEVGRALRETLASLDEHAPEIAAWAREASKGTAPGSRALVEAVVEAAGKDVHEAQAGVLSDFGIGRSVGPQSSTARTILAEHEGSRTWLVKRALRELGIASEVLVAEDEPFSADPLFPPHYGRFTHPLLLVHVKSPKPEDIWVDADVPGPPLPAGRLSPELRGRSAIRSDGSIVAVPALGGGAERDEIDIRLTLDANGDAKGSFAIVLRGRDAQELAEGLVRVVGDERQKALRGIVLAWVPLANVEDVALSSSEGSWQVAVRAQISVNGYAQIEGGRNGAPTSWVLPGLDTLHFVLPPRPRASSLKATYTGQGGREDALAINNAVQYHVRRRVELPPGAVVVRSPGPFKVSTTALQASRALAVHGGILEDEFVLDLSTGTIPAVKYESFVRDAHRTDDAFLAGTRVKPGT